MRLDPDAPQLTPDRRALVDRIIAEGDRRRRTWLVGGSAAVVLVIGLLAATLTEVGDGDPGRQVLATGDGQSAATSVPATDGPSAIGDPSPSTTTPAAPVDDGAAAPTTTSPPSPSTTVGPPTNLPGAWSALPPAGVPPRFGGVRVWTGRELLVWGGLPSSSDGCMAYGLDDEWICGDPAVFDGVAFDPATNTWRRMAAGPVPGGGKPTQTIPGGAWTGSELVVWGGFGSPVSAAYDPSRDTWRDLPPGPLAGGRRVTMAVLGGEVYVLRDASSPHSPSDANVGPNVAALNPTTGTWRALPEPPANRGVVASGVFGGEVVVALRDPAEGVTVAALAPTGQWRIVGRSPNPDDYYGSGVLADGRFWLAGCPSVLGASVTVTLRSVDLATGALAERPGPDRGCPQLVGAGSRLILTVPVPWDDNPTSIRAYEPTSTGWQELSPPPAAHLGGSVWTGAEVLFWGGCECSGMGGNAIEGGFRFRF